MDEVLRRIMSLLLLTISLPIHAGIVITGTRVIYPASKPEVSVSLTNKGKQDTLVQSWIDTGDPVISPEKIDSPFAVLPPISRVNGGKAQSLRIIYTGSQLPADRESVFWLNVLAIPPKIPENEASKSQYLKVAFQTRIKVFYRPKGLEINSDVAPSKLQWRKVARQINITNPTPYYISVASVTWKTNAKEYGIDGDMVAPFSNVTLMVKESLDDAREITFAVVNDRGAINYFNAILKSQE